MSKTIRNIINGERKIDISFPCDKKTFNNNFQDYLKYNKNYSGKIIKDKIEIQKEKMSIEDSLSLEGFNPSRYCSFAGSINEIESKQITIKGILDFRREVAIMQYVFFLLGIILLIFQSWKINFMIGLRSFGFICLMILLMNIHFGLVKMIFTRRLKDIANKNYVA